MEMSPKYRMKLIQEVNDKLFHEFNSYKNVEFYIEKWHTIEEYNEWEDNLENFKIYKKDPENIDLLKTLNKLDQNILLKIAIDLGIDTPDFIPSIPVFKNSLKIEYPNIHEMFNKALHEVEEHPDIAIGLANSTLESIIKEILKDKVFTIEVTEGNTLYELTQKLLKEFQMFPGAKVPEEINQIGSSLLKANQGIEKLRSSKTNFHGGTSEDYVINEPMYAYFIVNSVITIGLLINSIYKKKYKANLLGEDQTPLIDEDLPF